MKNCINNVLDRCKNNTDPHNLTNTATRARALAVIGSENYYCKDGMLNSFNRVNLQPDCRKKATKKVKNCVASFHKEFREDKASSSLCRLVTDLCIVQSLNSPQVLLYSFFFVSYENWEIHQLFRWLKETRSLHWLKNLDNVSFDWLKNLPNVSSD